MRDLLLAHWWKAVIVIITGGVITWGSWLTLLSIKTLTITERVLQKAEKTEKYVDMQVGVLHGRDTAYAVGQEADETRLENRLWEMQLRFFEDEIADCTEELEECEEGR